MPAQAVDPNGGAAIFFQKGVHTMKDIATLLRRGVLDLEPYVPGKPIEEVQEELGITDIAKMASNENPLGPSPKAVAAMAAELENVHLYPEGSCTLLRRRMAEKFGISPDMITLSNGADNCILLAASAFVNEGDEVLMADLTFFVYTTVTKIMGGRPVCVPLKDQVHDLAAMARQINERTKLIFICNPNNPTGTIVRRAELDAFVADLPEHVVVILDEAYCEFVDDPDCPDGLEYIRQGRPVVSLRTFSKLYGLAGLRIGYAMGAADTIAAFNRVREPFPVSRLAQAAAQAALEDDAFRRKVLENNAQGKAYLYEAFAGMGLPVVPTFTNFVLVDLQRPARDVFQALLQRGIIVRPGDFVEPADLRAGDHRHKGPERKTGGGPGGCPRLRLRCANDDCGNPLAVGCTRIDGKLDRKTKKQNTDGKKAVRHFKTAGKRGGGCL